MDGPGLSACLFDAISVRLMVPAKLKLTTQTNPISPNNTQEDQRHGQGVMTYVDGDRFEGAYVRDRREGLGVYRFAVRVGWVLVSGSGLGFVRGGWAVPSTDRGVVWGPSPPHPLIYTHNRIHTNTERRLL